MLDSAGKGVAKQGQLRFLAERSERLDIPDGYPVCYGCMDTAAGNVQRND